MKPVIIGAGLAGLTVALSLAPRPVVVISPRKLGTECSSAWAQGGIAAAVGLDDSPALHAADTLAAGDGLCQPGTVQQVTQDGPAIIDWLAQFGVGFDRDAAGALRLGLEAAHSRHRIVHAGGGGTGGVIMQALVRAVRATPSIEVIEEASVTAIHAPDGGLQAVTVMQNGEAVTWPAACVVLATGGTGALWRDTTNPLGSWGQGLALAARTGATLGDLEFMQFHPTAIATGPADSYAPLPLASEALRGEGCTLIDETGARFTAELQRRDIVARAIAAHNAAGHHTFLDARAALGTHFAARFPAINALCRQAGIDPATMPIPVRPAAHYHMGGVVTDGNGRSSIMGLWACGEVACTGLHGANRLASNSLLEAASLGRLVAQDIADYDGQPDRAVRFLRQPATPQLVPDHRLRDLMTAQLGVTRDGAGMRMVLRYAQPAAAASDPAAVALMIAVAALARTESRGAHARLDFPQTDATPYRRRITLTEALRAAAQLIDRSAAA